MSAVPFVRFDPETGAVLSAGVCNECDLVHQGPDGTVLQGQATPDSHYVANGQLVAYTTEQFQARMLRPHWARRWCNQTMAWLDDRDATQRAADDRAAVQAARRGAYPPIGDQLDALWHAMGEGVLPKVQPWYDAIAAVKAAHPKP